MSAFCLGLEIPHTWADQPRILGLLSSTIMTRCSFAIGFGWPDGASALVSAMAEGYNKLSNTIPAMA